MQLVVLANDAQWDELTQSATQTTWIRITDSLEFINYPEAAAFFNLTDQSVDLDYKALTKPVFINAVNKTLSQNNFPENVLRINGWPGFLQRPVWEIAGSNDENCQLIAVQLNKTFVSVADEPGLIAARIIATIINEAFFALGDEVSTKKEIDTAMKLGTNYPYGPFEWSEMIGIKNIFELLQQLSLSDKRYQPADLLKKEAQQ